MTLSAPQPVGATGIAFDPALGQLLVGRQYIDLDGTARGTLSGIPADFFGNTFIRLTSGPYAEQIAGIDSVGSELVIFQP